MQGTLAGVLVAFWLGKETKLPSDEVTRVISIQGAAERYNTDSAVLGLGRHSRQIDANENSPTRSCPGAATTYIKSKGGQVDDELGYQGTIKKYQMRPEVVFIYANTPAQSLNSLQQASAVYSSV